LFSHKHRKWIHAVFSSLLKISVANAWLIFQSVTLETLPQIECIGFCGQRHIGTWARKIYDA